LEGIITQTLLRRKDGTGRIAAHEILLATPAIRNLIREDKIPQIQSIMQLGTKLGMCTMKDRLYALMEEGVIFSDDVRSLTISASNEAGSTSDDARQPTHKPMTQGDF
jgi:twitching motility protein PilT